MTKADKRARKKENQAKARAQAAAAAKKRERISQGKRLAGLLAIVALAGTIFVVATRDEDKPEADETTTATSLPEGCESTVPEAQGNGKTYEEPGDAKLDPAKFYSAVIATSCGEFTVALSKDSPETVNSFVFLARDDFYDGLSFHRIAKDFVIQGGDPSGDGNGDPGYSIEDEPPVDGYRVGSVAMANSGPGTTGSQFFVALTDQGAQGLGATPPYLYSDLGIVVDGMDVVTTMGSLANPDQTDDLATQKPVVPLYIFDVTIIESDTPTTTTAAPATTTTAAPTSTEATA